MKAPSARPAFALAVAVAATMIAASTLAPALAQEQAPEQALDQATAPAEAGSGKVFAYADKALALEQIRWAGDVCPGISINEAGLAAYRAEAPAMPTQPDAERRGYIWGASQTWKQVVFLSNPDFWCGRIRLMGEMEPNVNSGLAILYESARALNQALVFAPLDGQ